MKRVLLGTLLFLLFTGIALSAEQWEVRLEEAKVNIDQGQYQNAADLLQGIAPDHSNSMEVNYYLGLSKMAQGKLEEAEKSLKAAEKLAPEDVLVKLDLANVLIAENKAREAGPELDFVLTKQPNNGRAIFLKGLAAISQNDCSTAAPYLAKAKPLLPDKKAEIAYYQGLCAKSESKVSEARNYFDETISAGKDTKWAAKATEQKASMPELKKWFVNADVFYQNDSNIVPVAGIEALPKDISHKADSRAVVWLAAGYRPIMTEKGQLGAEYHFYNAWQFQQDLLNLEIHQGELNGLVNFKLGKMPARFYTSYLYQYALLGSPMDYYSSLHRINPMFYLAENKNFVTELSYFFESEKFDQPGEKFFDRDNTKHQVMLGEHYYLAKGKVDLAGFARYEKDFAEGRDYTADRMGLRVIASFAPWHKLSGWAYFDYDHRDYYRSTFNRLDEVYQYAGEIDYEVIKHLQVFAGASYGDYNSTIEPFDYTRSIYSAGLKTTF